jgi:glycosyltransferase involved in cell wall biosynthesis
MVKLLRLLECLAYRSADLIVVVSPAFISHIVSMGARKDKIHVVENGVDFKLFEKPSGGSSFRHAHGLEGKTVAAYVGTFGMAHHLQTILEAAEITREDSSIVYLLVGGGSDLANLEHHRRRLALENVVILGQQPRETMPLVWSATDIALVLLRRSPLFLSVIPSKMFEAMAMSRPIILGVDGQARRILDAGGCGVAIEPENAVALAAAVRELASDARSRELLGAAGLDFVRQNYDRRALARRYEYILAGVVHPSHDAEAAEQLA